ncbi:MAG UNVERIFIED_CONTAM: hypothetical protein LVR29_14600 [Microcystis novacekii LVE1205-3]
MNSPKEIHDALMRRVAQRYEKEGYRVFIEPQRQTLPFNLGSYRPDLLAMKSENDGYIIEIKTNANRVSDRSSFVNLLKLSPSTTVGAFCWLREMIFLLMNQSKKVKKIYFRGNKYLPEKKKRKSSFLLAKLKVHS